MGDGRFEGEETRLIVHMPGGGCHDEASEGEEEERGFQCFHHGGGVLESGSEEHALGIL